MTQADVKVGDRVLIERGKYRALTRIAKVLKSGIKVPFDESIYKYNGRCASDNTWYPTIWRLVSEEEYVVISKEIKDFNRLKKVKETISLEIKNSNNLQLMETILLLIVNEDK